MLDPIDIINCLFEKLAHRCAFDYEIRQILKTPGNWDTLSIIEESLKFLVNSSPPLLLAPSNPSFSSIDDQDIFYSYKFLLGRLPESSQVYEIQKQFFSVPALIEAIVSSAEFKENSILKSTISLRRKPNGHESYNHCHLATSQQNIVVLTGCQGKMIADLIQAKTGLPGVSNFFIGGGHALENFVSSNGKSYTKILDKADLIYTQKMEIFALLTKHPLYSTKTRLLPLIEYSGFQPDQCYISNKKNGQPILGPLGEYQSIIVSSAYFSGLSSSKTAQLFKPETYELLKFSEHSALSLESLIDRGTHANFPIIDLISKWNSRGPWMRTINHPKKHVLNDLVEIALKRESISIIEGSDEFVTDDLAANVDWPIYPNLLRAPATLPLKFKLPKALAPSTSTATFLDLQSFIDLSFKSLEKFKLEDIYCHQAGRHINLSAPSANYTGSTP